MCDVLSVSRLKFHVTNLNLIAVEAPVYSDGLFHLFDETDLEWFVVHTKGSQVKISKLRYSSDPESKQTVQSLIKIRVLLHLIGGGRLQISR